MRFLPDGPNLPDELLEARDAGSVVFFCGAGISRPALPGFFDLADQVIAEFNPPEGSASLALLDQIRSNSVFSPPLDQVFNLLQQEYGAAAVDDVVNSILRKKSVRASAEQHAIVLRLSQSASRQTQVVTTNFDRLFEKSRKGLRRYSQPALPDLASGQPLEGLVYLHGRMPTQPSDGTQRLGFVLSSADFGRAYLADGWATRFVRELLQRYVIVLLGYSATDPPVRYLLEGLHSRADKIPATIYTFDSGTDDDVQVRWRDRGVQPLSYTNSDGSHSALWNSLSAWAHRADDPDAWRRSIITLSQGRPRDLQPDQRGQVASLVKSDRGAKLFAEAVPPPPAEWLCVFDRHVRYGSPRGTPRGEDDIEPLSAFCLDDDSPRPAKKPWADGDVSGHLLFSPVRSGALVGLGSFAGRQIAPLPDRLFWLARWVSAVINEPTAAWWAAGHGLHETLLNLISWRLHLPDENIDPKARKIWSLIVESYRHSPTDERWFDFVRVLKREGWISSTLREFERIATPYLSISRPFSTEPLPPEGSWDELRRAQIASFEVKFPPEHAEKFEVSSDALPAVFRILCRGLQHAAGLLADIETAYWETTTFHAERKPGVHHLDEADRYLLRVVQFFDRLAAEHPTIARAEVSQWPLNEEFFFDKLKIYALMRADLFSGHECAEAIVALSDDGFWSRHHRRELLHTLRARWSDFSPEDRQLVEARILRGPDR